jgi:hypothetical protein
MNGLRDVGPRSGHAGGVAARPRPTVTFPTVTFPTVTFPTGAAGRCRTHAVSRRATDGSRR